MYVYFIRTETKPALVKIGKANDVEARLVQLQTGSPTKLRVCYKIKCKSEAHAFEIEHALHEIYKDIRVQGEWFKYTGNLKSMTQFAQDKNLARVQNSLNKHKSQVSRGHFK